MRPASLLQNIMGTVTKISTWLLGLFGSLILVILLIPLGMMLLGYRVNADPSKVASLAAEKSDVSLCRNILNYGLFGPPSGLSRAECVNEYAHLAHDPSACALLMPSEYGMSCLGAAKEKGDTCTLEFGRVVEWGSYLDGTRERATLQDCLSSTVSKGLGQQCCTISKVAHTQELNDCSSLQEDQELYAECLSALALKESDPTICSPITGTGTRITCQLRAKYRSVLTTLPAPIHATTVTK